jgi:hypothetical protein
MKKIQVGGHCKKTKIFYALVDDADYNYINRFKWSPNGNGYAISTVGIVLSDNKKIKRLMHRMILNPNSNEEIDHKDQNRLNNQRKNIRIATHNENQRNAPAYKNNKSGLKGVSWHGLSRKWAANIKVNGKTIYLGEFLSKEEASIAYNRGATKYHKEFANLN